MKTAAERYDAAIWWADARITGFPAAPLSRVAARRDECIAAIEEAVAEGVAEALMSASEVRSLIIAAAVAEERARCLAIFDEGGWQGAGRSRIEHGDFVQTAPNRDNEPGDSKAVSGSIWSVSVEIDGKNVVTIEEGCLSGREIGTAEEEAIRTAARHLLAFIGDTPPP